MALSRSGLQAKILFMIAITVVSVVAVSTYLAATWLTRLPVEEEIYRKALGQAKLTAHEVGNDLALRNPDEALRILRQVQRDAPGIIQGDVYLHNPEHKLLVSTDQGGDHLELDSLPGVERYNEFERPEPDQISIETPDGKYWIIDTRVRQQDGWDGCLVLKVSKSRSSVITRDLVTRNLMVTLASLIAIGVAIHFFFRKNVGIPVTEMIQVMKAAEGGQLDVRAHVPSSDELGQLGEHLNRMLGRLENFNTELNRKVEEATSELARRNEELNRINEELFETQRTLARSQRLAVAGQLAASLAHEIGTPLNSISGHVQLMARCKTGDEATDRRLQIIEKQIDSIVRSVKQLLSWTRKFELRVAPLDLRHVLEETVLLSSAALQLRNIKVKTEWARNCPLIYGDAGYLQQVFLNLINNSMDAMPRGGVLSIRLSYPHGGDPEAVGVEVSDTGEGMATETLRRVFDPMFTTKRMGAGTGLGLAICKQIISQHAGTIQVESEPGHGTQFAVVLPTDCRDKLEAVGVAASTENGE
jgi:two-component system, NtrC family, sensor kinase